MKIDGAGEAVRRVREATGLQQKEFAERANMNASTLCRYENGERALTLDVIRQIAIAAGKPEEVLTLECLQIAYPRLGESTAGALLKKLVKALE